MCAGPCSENRQPDRTLVYRDDAVIEHTQASLCRRIETIDLETAYFSDKGCPVDHLVEADQHTHAARFFVSRNVNGVLQVDECVCAHGMGHALRAGNDDCDTICTEGGFQKIG